MTTRFIHPAEYGKVIAVSTAKVYSGKLNKLARAGFDTVESLQADPNAVIETIEKLIPGTDEKSKVAKRYLLCSIFWVLPKAYTTVTNPYHKYYQQCLPERVQGTDTVWTKKAVYKSIIGP